jgi:hypothetical protein
MQQDPLLVSLGCDSTSVLLPLTHFAFGVERQIKRESMAGILAPEGSQHGHTIVVGQPLIWNGDQEIHVGIGPGCAPGMAEGVEGAGAMKTFWSGSHKGLSAPPSPHHRAPPNASSAMAAIA